MSNDFLSKNNVYDFELSDLSALVFEGKKRYYFEDLSQRDYTLINTTPYLLIIEDKCFQYNSWSKLICNLSAYLLERFPEKAQQILEFKTPWCNQPMFSSTKRCNFEIVKESLFVNVNHTAVHSCWLIQDLISYFGIDVSAVTFFIHRSPAAEQPNVKCRMEDMFVNNFLDYMINIKKLSQKYAQGVIAAYKECLNKELKKTSASYDSFFLFDDKQYASNYANELKKNVIINNPKFNLREQAALKNYIDLLIEYYKFVAKKQEKSSAIYFYDKSQNGDILGKDYLINHYNEKDVYLFYNKKTV